MENLGDWVKSKLPRGASSSNFTEAFVSTSLVFCIGAMAIVGSIEDSLNHDYTILFTKAVMDGVLSIVFAASLGIGAGIFHVSYRHLSRKHHSSCRSGKAISYRPDDRTPFLYRFYPYFCPWFKTTIGTKIKIANLLPAVFLPVIVCLLGF